MHESAGRNPYYHSDGTREIGRVLSKALELCVSLKFEPYSPVQRHRHSTTEHTRSMSVAETTPVVVGVARYTHRIQNADLSDALTPLQLLERTVTRALQDAKLKGTDIDCVATMEFWHEMLVPPKTPKHYPNPPKSVATLIGAAEAIEKNHLYAHPTGGNGPQELINILGEMISTSKIRSAVICGAEGLAGLKKGLAAGMSLPGVTEMRRKLSDKKKSQLDTSGKELPWGDDPGGEPQRFLKSEGMAAYVTRRMVQTGLVDPTVAYAIFEQAYRKECYPNVSREQYQRELARLMSEFSQLAAADPANAWDPHARTPEEIATPGPGNRYVAFPYTRAMNSFIDVDQSAAVILMLGMH